MTISNSFFAASLRVVVIAGLAITGGFAVVALAMALPSFAHAATYAYVNQTGEVSTVTADAPMTALMTAPNIDERSGVLLLDSQADIDVVGDGVPGV